MSKAEHSSNTACCSRYQPSALYFHFLKVSYCLYLVFALLFWGVFLSLLPISPFLCTKRPIPACLPAAGRLWGSSLLSLALYVGLSVYHHAGRAEYQFLVYRPQWMCVLFFLSVTNPSVNLARGLSRAGRTAVGGRRCCCHPPGAVPCPKTPVRPVSSALFGGHNDSSLHVHCLLYKWKCDWQCT